MKLIFMGTPDFSVGTLEALLAAGHEVALVVTQPDKPKGRGKTLQFSPAKEAALNHQIPVYQPRRIREAESVEYLNTIGADAIVVVAFGQILPKEILDMPPYGCINVHASLLPKYRGAAPIQWAIIDGLTLTGVTTMRMDAGLDTGDMILKEEIAIAPKETGGSLFEKLSLIGARLCVETLDRIAQNTAVYTPQNHDEATKVGMITKRMGRIDWSYPAERIECLIRGLNPWPSAYTSFNGRTIKIWDADVVPKERIQTLCGQVNHADANCAGEGRIPPGTIIFVSKTAVFVQTGDGVLQINEVQPEGKKRMATGAFLLGNPMAIGDVLD